MGLISFYSWLVDEIADDRVKDWALMSSPFKPMSIVIVYLYVIKVLLPNYMKHKEPYDLKTVIQCYNIFQIVANSYAFYEVLTSGWSTVLRIGCILPDYSTDPEALRLVGALHFFLMLKVVELIETVFFILRKKDNQASFLHVYHHSMTMNLLWVGIKYVAGGMTCFPVAMNAFVHVIMYTYYFISAAASPDIRRKLDKYKPWLTIIQMIQFTAAIVHGLQALLPSCQAPKLVVFLYIPNVFLVYYLFLDFFKNSYGKTDKSKKKA